MLAALYQCCQRRPLSSIPQSGWFADSQPAESACSPRRSFHPAASALLPPHTHPSCLADPSNPVPPLLFLSSFAPLGLWRWASPQWHYCTDCSASSSNGGCSLVNTHVRTGCAALPSSTFCLVILVSNQSLSLYVCIFFLPPSCAQVSRPWPWLCNAEAALCHLRARPKNRKHSLRLWASLVTAVSQMLVLKSSFISRTCKECFCRAPKRLYL